MDLLLPLCVIRQEGCYLSFATEGGKVTREKETRQKGTEWKGTGGKETGVLVFLPGARIGHAT